MNEIETGRAAHQNEDDPGLQPEVADEVFHSALVARIEKVAPAVREAQLAVDRETLLQLQLSGFTGSDWDRTARGLVVYAYGTLPKKIRTGEIFPIMRELGVPPAHDLTLPDGIELLPEDVEDLTQDVISLALPRFKEVLMTGGWDPSREHVCCLSSFFFGQCCLRFRTPWRRWLRANYRRRLSQAGMAIEDLLDRSDESARPDLAAAARLEVARVLAPLPPDLQAILLLDALDWSDARIAEQLGLSLKAVEYRLMVARRKVRGRRGGVA